MKFIFEGQINHAENEVEQEEEIWELLQIVENGGLATAVFYICSSVSVCG